MTKKLTANRDRITQAELEELQQLRRLDTLKSELRNRLVVRLEEGVPIESGPLTVHLNSTSTAILNKKSLTPILGHDGVEHLQSRVEPTKRTVLRIGGLVELARFDPACPTAVCPFGRFCPKAGQ